MEVNPLVQTAEVDWWRWTARSPSTRTPTSGIAMHESSWTRPRRTRSRCGQGEGPQLRQARRRGGHHRQRRGAGDVHPRRGRLRRGGVRRPEAGELPRHRRGRQRGGHGQRPRHHPVRPAGQESVFVNVFGGITSCVEVANGIVGALDALGERGATQPLVCGSTATTSRRAGASSRRATSPASIIESRPWTGLHDVPPSLPRPTDPRARRRHETPMAIFLTATPRHRPGHDRLGGHEAHHADAALRRLDRRRGEPAQGRHDGEFAGGAPCPCSGPSPRRWRPPGRRLGHVRPARFTKDAVIEAVDAGIPLAVVITEGVAVQDTAEFYNVRQGQGDDPHHRAELPRHHQPRRKQRGHHPRRHHRARADRPGQQVGNADLPDDVRAPGLRLLVGGRDRRRPDHRDDAHRLLWRPSRPTRTPMRSS